VAYNAKKTSKLSKAENNEKLFLRHKEEEDPTYSPSENEDELSEVNKVYILFYVLINSKTCTY